MEVERAFEVLKAIVSDYDRTSNEGHEAIRVIKEKLFDLREDKACLERRIEYVSRIDRHKRKNPVPECSKCSRSFSNR
jgi:hypothetical protein